MSIVGWSSSGGLQAKCSICGIEAYPSGASTVGKARDMARGAGWAAVEYSHVAYDLCPTCFEASGIRDTMERLRKQEREGKS